MDFSCAGMTAFVTGSDRGRSDTKIRNSSKPLSMDFSWARVTAFVTMTRDDTRTAVCFLYSLAFPSGRPRPPAFFRGLRYRTPASVPFLLVGGAVFGLATLDFATLF